jgi:tellurite methyltransferase
LDKNYWNKYYSKHNALGEPSSFAKSIIKNIPIKSKLMELGCGNGRDSYYFASKGHNVTACDQSEKIIDSLPKLNINSPNFITADINSLPNDFNHFFNVVYARFVLHALDDYEAKNAINWTFNNLEKNGIFFSESRSIKDPIFGEGQKVKKQIYKTDHQRRFLKKSQIVKDLIDEGFVIDDVVEDHGLAVYKDSDPVVIRIVARKP